MSIYIYIYIYIYIREWRGINHAMIYAIDYVLHHLSSGRLGIPTCIWWDIVCLHFLTRSKYINTRFHYPWDCIANMEVEVKHKKT
jgi:hypothetical protein